MHKTIKALAVTIAAMAVSATFAQAKISLVLQASQGSQGSYIEMEPSIDLSKLELAPTWRIIGVEANLTQSLYGTFSGSSSSDSSSGSKSGGKARVDKGASLGTSSGNVKAVIDLSEQKMRVSINDVLRHEWPISSGLPGYSTPTGSFSPQRAYTDYYSKKYDLAAMPSAVFFNGGVAVHGTYEIGKLGRPASHGCVRLSPQNAQAFLQLARTYGKNIRIIVQH